MAIGENQNETNVLTPAFSDYTEVDQEPKETEPVVEDQFKLVLNPDVLSYRDYVQLVTLTVQTKFAAAIPIVMRATVGWTYPLPFSQDAYRNLPFADLGKIVLAALRTLDQHAQNIDAAEAKVDAARWNMGDYIDYVAAQQKKDFDKIEALLRKISRMESLRSGDAKRPLKFVEGVLISKAVADSIGGMFTGGK